MRRWPARRLSGRIGAALAACALVAGGVAWAAAAKSAAAIAIDTTLAKRGADGIVLLGNSKVSTDLDLDLVQSALQTELVDGGLAPGAPTIANANVFGTSAPVWYAVLENRVYGNGYSPRLLVIFAPLAAMLTTDLPSEAQRAVLGEQLGEDEPVVAAKVFQGSLTAEVRTRLHRLLLPACHPDHLREQDDSPGKPARRPAGAVTAPDVAPEASFLADLLALTAAHGTRTVLVRAPLGPSRAVQEEVPPERVAAVVALVKNAGAGWIDLSDGAPEAAFGDGVHMNTAGRAAMSRKLARALAPVVAGGPLPVEPPPAPARIAVRRVGTPPAAVALPVRPRTAVDIPYPGSGSNPHPCARVAEHPLLGPLGDAALTALGYGPISPLVARQGKALLRSPPDPSAWEGCTGVYTGARDTLQIAAWAALGETFTLEPSADFPLRGPDGEEAWWVYPGTQIEVEVPPLKRGETVRVQGGIDMKGVPRGDPPIAFPREIVDGRPLEPGEATWTLGDERHVLGWDTKAKGGETRIVIAAPPGGQWTLVHSVEVGETYVLGGELAAHVDLLRQGGSFATFPPELPPMEAALATAKPAPDGASIRVAMPPGVPTHEAGFDHAGVGRCSPLVVEGPHAAELNAVPSDNGLVLASRDCAAVGTRAKGLTWRLDTTRACGAREYVRWLYPDDTFVLSAPLPRPLLAWNKAIRLDLGGGLVGSVDPAATLRVDVSVNGKTIAKQEFALARFESDPPSLEIPVRGIPYSETLEVSFTISPGPTWLLLTSALLVGSSAPSFAGWAAG